MAASNMIVTLAMNASNYSKGLRKSSQETMTFGKFAAKSFAMVGAAVGALGGAFISAIPDLIKLGTESRKADLRLRYMAENMAGLGEESQKTAQRLSDYADTVQRATGIDDESIKAIQAKLLVFKGLQKSAGVTGGMFDRVTKAAIDMGAIGFGTAETNAIRLARMMQDPIKNLGLLNRLGVVFTDAEKRKATALEETNGKLAASEYLMGLIESKVGGLAEKTSDPLSRLAGQFENIAESIAEKFLPKIDEVAEQIAKWLDGPAGAKAVDSISGAFKKFIDYVGNAQNLSKIEKLAKAFGKLADALVVIIDITDKLFGFPRWLVEAVFGAQKAGKLSDALDYLDNPNRGSNTSTDGNTGNDGYVNSDTRRGTKAGIVVNFNTPVDSVSAGREIRRVLSDYDRANGVR